MAVITMSDEEKMKLIREVADDCWTCKINAHQAILIVSGVVRADADVTPLIAWLNEKREHPESR